MPTIKQQLQDDIKQAMRDRDKDRLGALRFIMAALKQIEVDERIDDVDDTRVIVILDKLAKQRREGIEAFKNAGRDELAKKEQFELTLLSHYLPEALPDTEIEQMIQAAISETGASEMKDMGKVMAILRPKLQGRADLSAVSAKIKQLLSQ